MSSSEWFFSDFETCRNIFLSTLSAYIVLIVLVRLNGLRTFSKMSSFDFAITIATGSVFATVITSKSPSLTEGAVAFASLIGVQALIAFARRFTFVRGVVDNNPLLLMDGSEILHDNMKRGKVALCDLKAKLREANVLNYGQVRAVVLESTGDISVLHARDESVKFDSDLIEGVSR